MLLIRAPTIKTTMIRQLFGIEQRNNGAKYLIKINKLEEQLALKCPTLSFVCFISIPSNRFYGFFSQ